MNTLWLYTIACTPEGALANIRAYDCTESIEYIQRECAKITNLEELGPGPNFKIFYIEVGVFGEPEPE